MSAPKGQPTKAKASAPPQRPDGLASRRFAVSVIEDAIRRRLPLDERLERLGTDPVYAALPASDRGMTRAIAYGTMRRLGTIRRALAERMTRGMPVKAGRLEPILIAAAAQILELGTSPHAAVDTAVTLAREDAFAMHFTDLANAVLRRIAAEKADILAASDPLLTDTPAWLADRWRATYGPEIAARIAAAHRQEPSIDISVTSDPEGWAERLGADVLPTGSLRLSSRTAIRQLPGYAEGAWWVQDAAAALPARLLGDVRGLRVLDICAAPGGKTAQLAATGALVTALDRSAPRMERLDENMARLGLTVETVVADALTYRPDEPFDAVLIDAPCSATGTIRRHPEVAHARTLEDIHKLKTLQSRLLDHAAEWLKPGGRLVYATCSLEPEEGERQIEGFLARNSAFQLSPIATTEIPGLSEVITPKGMLRSLPFHMPHETPRMAGMDGFFAARLVYRAG